MRGPRAQVVVLAREDREKLERIERAATSEQREVLRARIVLQAAEVVSKEAIGRNLGVTDRTARKWRARFVADGMGGLKDRRRSGRPARLDGVVRCQVISLACRPVPPECCRTEWTLCSIREALLEADVVDTISTSTIGRILNHADLRPHRYRMWVHSPDPEFARKVREVVGLYLSPPRPDRVVLCIDEKTGMQALRRRFAARLPRPGAAGRWEFEYRRHGTRTLLAAFNVHTGHVVGRCGPTRRAEDLLAFMEDVSAHYPTQRIDVVWDNLNIHGGRRWEEFNARHHSRFQFHHTPIHASWVNQVELWFGILQRRVLRRASFRDATELVERVEAFIRRWNELERKPFRWTFTGYPVQAGLPKVA